MLQAKSRTATRSKTKQKAQLSLGYPTVLVVSESQYATSYY